MAIVLSETEVTACTVFVGDDTFALVAGEKLRIQKGPAGSPTDVYFDTVPAGKTWNVTVYLRIDEV